MTFLPLIGIAVLVAGFGLKLNPLLVIIAAAITTGLAAGLDVVAVIAAFGRAFNDSRYVSVIWVVLPVIGVLERAGLKERAAEMVRGLKAISTSRLIAIYFILRQVTCALGLISLGGHAQMVRPLLAPMALATAEQRYGPLPASLRERIQAHCAAADNVARFFGEDIFIAIGSILLIKGFLEQSKIVVEPLKLSLWAMPTALAALLIHGARMLLLERTLQRSMTGVPK